MEVIRHIPIITTVLAVIFGAAVFRRYLAARIRLYLFWWAAGIYIYGDGTLTEALSAVLGWEEPVFRAWYISGALLGGDHAGDWLRVLPLEPPNGWSRPRGAVKTKRCSLRGERSKQSPRRTAPWRKGYPKRAA